MELKELITTIETMRTCINMQKAALCRLADITPQYYDLIINNKVPGVAYSVVYELAKHVGISFSPSVGIPFIISFLSQDKGNKSRKQL